MTHGEITSPAGEIMYTRQQIEDGEGRYARGKTCIVQKGSKDVFETHPASSSWKIAPGWHIAGSASPSGKIEWCDLIISKNSGT